MMFNPSFYLFLSSLIFSTLMCVTSCNWLIAWVGLELNLLSFIPLLISSLYVRSSESALKYFLVQALSSMLFLFSLLLTWFDSTSLFGLDSFNGLIIISLFIKLGLAPFHMWLPEVAGGIGWLRNYILISWQKVAPIILCYYIIDYNFILYGVLLIRSLVGSLGGLNQLSLRKMMAFSSINHLSWLVAGILCGFNYFLVYFMVYIMIGGVLVFQFSFMNCYYLSQIYYYSGSTRNMFLFMFNWLSYGGLPPFLGFISKWLILDLLIINNLTFIRFFMVIIRLISLYYYCRVCYVVINQSGGLILSLCHIADKNFYLIMFSLLRFLRLIFTPLIVCLI